MKVWQGGNTPPLPLCKRVVVEFRDGRTSDKGTVLDWHGAGGVASNWCHFGDNDDIVGYKEMKG